MPRMQGGGGHHIGPKVFPRPPATPTLFLFPSGAGAFQNRPVWKDFSMADHLKQLPVPQPALNDARAGEKLRVWAAGGKQHVSLATGLWKDPASWGIMLTDLARHVARAYEQSA